MILDTKVTLGSGEVLIKLWLKRQREEKEQWVQEKVAKQGQKRGGWMIEGRG